MTDHTFARSQISMISSLLEMDQENGHGTARTISQGYIAGASAYIEKIDGPLAAYQFVQRLADEIAERIPVRTISVQRRRTKE
jgi:hypothetical protein